MRKFYDKCMFVSSSTLLNTPNEVWKADFDIYIEKYPITKFKFVKIITLKFTN